MNDHEARLDFSCPTCKARTVATVDTLEVPLIACSGCGYEWHIDVCIFDPAPIQSAYDSIDSDRAVGT